MIIVFRVIEGWGRGIAQFQGTRLGVLLLHSLKIHVLPVTAGAVLHLAGNGIHAGFDVERAGQVHKEDVSATTVGHSRAPHAHRRLGDVQGILFRMNRDVVSYPGHEF